MDDVFDRQSDRALEGLSGWLYLKDNGNIADFLGLRILSEKKKEKLRLTFEGRQKWLEEKGIHYLLVVPPNKPVVYPENLPEEIQADRGVDGMMQWRGYLASLSSSLHLLDLRDELIARKAKEPLYFSNDTHWSHMGSYVGYCAVIKRLSE